VERGQVTELLYAGDIQRLEEAVAAYLVAKDEVWILVDNLDKGWPTRGASSEDILVLRALLDATRKLERQLEHRDIPLRCLVFVRNDIYEHLLRDTPDRGKDTQILLDWDDPELFKDLVLQRIMAGFPGEIEGSFDDIWPMLFEPTVGVQHSFDYILERTLMRPRDLLNFLHRAVEVAVNRGHEKVTEHDILAAERRYSEDMLLETSFELCDVHPRVKEPLYEFLGCPARMSLDEVRQRLLGGGFETHEFDEILHMLVWFGFLGSGNIGSEAAQFAYTARYTKVGTM